MRQTRFISLAFALMATVVAPAAAVTPIGESGTTGAYAIVDTSGSPQARCGYDSGAGSHYLGWIRSRSFAMYGLRDELQQVGYRILLQRRKPAGWKTVAAGPLRTAMADKDVGTGVAASKVLRDPATQPNDARYRAVLRLLWFDTWDDSVEGRLLLRVDHHRRSFNGSQGRACRGQVSTGIGGAAAAPYVS